MSGFKGSHQWMAPELYGVSNEGTPDLPTYQSDVFSLGMVTFEVRDAYHRGLPHSFDTPLVPSLRCLPDECHSTITELRQ